MRADAFDIQHALGGEDAVLNKIKQIEKQGKDASKLDKDLLTILEVVYEMNLRGIELLPVDIYASKGLQFTIEGNAIRPPFNAVSGVGSTAALAMEQNRGSEPFISMEDFQNRTNANTAVMTALEEAGCFKNLPKTNQITLFSL